MEDLTELYSWLLTAIKLVPSWPKKLGKTDDLTKLNNINAEYVKLLRNCPRTCP